MPTTYEIIFWIVLAIVVFIFCGKALKSPNDYIEITDKKLKEWEKQERKWR